MSEVMNQVSERTIHVPEYKELVEVAKDWEYGSVHTHEEIEAIMEIPMVMGRYYNMISKANDKLTIVGKRLESIKGIGYQVIKPDDYTDVSIKTANSGRRKIRRAVEIIDSAPVTHMTPHGRARHTNISDRMHTLEAATDKSVIGIERLNRKTIALNSARG